jgi:hypothetical protein
LTPPACPCAVVTRNLNKIIDVNFYPVEAAERSNLRHRPIGIGVQGLADTFLLLGLPFDSEVGPPLAICAGAPAVCAACAGGAPALPLLTGPRLLAAPPVGHAAGRRAGGQAGNATPGPAPTLPPPTPFPAPPPPQAAAQLNKEIFECVYFNALTTSCELAAKEGPYSSYPGCPVSKGILQHDMWGVQAPSTRCGPPAPGAAPLRPPPVSR